MPAILDKQRQQPKVRWASLMGMLTLSFAAWADVPQATLRGQAIVVLATVVVVILCVVLHYEALSLLTSLLKRLTGLRPRRHILLLIFSILLTHVIEIWVFGGAYLILGTHDGTGSLVASHPIQLLDSIYFSAVCFTTLGMGDVVPMGAVRFLAGTEALTGFVLVTWSASFTFVEMQRFWKA